MATSAATRVFGIAELLDMILHEYAASEQQLKPFRPVTKLYVLQRVNHMFNGAINSSIVLRRAMFLEHADAEEANNISLNSSPQYLTDRNLAAVEWLLNSGLTAARSFEFCWCRKPLTRFPPAYVLDKANILTRGMLCPTASWRRMKMYRSPVMLQVAIYCCSLGEEYGMEEEYDAYGTLGEFSVTVFEIFERSVAEHRVLSLLARSSIRKNVSSMKLSGWYTAAEARDLLAFLDDVQKDVGGGKGGNAWDGKTMGKNRKGSSKKRRGRKSGKDQK